VTASSTCYHEAGHALAAIALGYRIRTVSVDPFGHGAGLVELDEAFGADPAPAELEHALVIAFAGREAERYA
jgi:ATP-dependent Zn protease